MQARPRAPLTDFCTPEPRSPVKKGQFFFSIFLDSVSEGLRYCTVKNSAKDEQFQQKYSSSRWHFFSCLLWGGGGRKGGSRLSTVPASFIGGNMLEA